MTKKIKKDVLVGEIEMREVKVRITTFIDGDILLKLKKMAKSKKIPYQTLLNETLRMSLESPTVGAKMELKLEVDTAQII